MFYFLFIWGMIELVVIILVANLIGPMLTLGLLLLGMIAGSMILKQTRLYFSQCAQQGRPLADNAAGMKNALFRVLGGMLLFIPGFLSDALAVVCMIPALRNVFGGLLLKLFRPDVVVQRFGYRQADGGYVYEGRVKKAVNDGEIEYEERRD